VDAFTSKKQSKLNLLRPSDLEKTLEFFQTKFDKLTDNYLATMERRFTNSIQLVVDEILTFDLAQLEL
jgi:hypothetical protein